MPTFASVLRDEMKALVWGDGEDDGVAEGFSVGIDEGRVCELEAACVM